MSEITRLERISVTLVGSRGSIEAAIGDRFPWHDGTKWEITAFPGALTYSPSGVGGCPVVTCRHLSGTLDAVMAKYTVDGLCDWCGDSVATALINMRDGGR